jgi:Domain of unknown function (DUF397)
MRSNRDVEVCREMPTGLWRKSSFSAHNGNCVEIAPFAGRVAVRDSKNPEGAPVILSSPAWTAFVATIKG